MADEVLLEMMRNIHSDVVTIRDNHLAHIAEDITDMKVEQSAMRKDLDEVMTFKQEVEKTVSTLLIRVVGVAGGAVTAALGLPLLM
tara:strand:- start:21932 stop:22189 length:258 start_codon:yes stop_codon:yes gene_type:complete